MKMRFISLLMLVCVSVSPLFADSALLAANPAAESVLSAYSTREFSEEPLKAGQLDLILQAGANAPSAQNRQPWTFIVVENSEIRSRLFKSLPEACAVVVVSVPVEDYCGGGNSQFAAGTAAESMYLMAQGLGLGAHMYTFPAKIINETPEIKTGLKIGDDSEAAVVLAFGNTDEADTVSGASGRNNIDDFVVIID